MYEEGSLALAKQSHQRRELKSVKATAEGFVPGTTLGNRLKGVKPK
jgi:hypothetical protein